MIVVLSVARQDVHALPEGPPVLGVTLLAGEIYLLRDRTRDQVEVYDATTYSIRDYVTVPIGRQISDMTSCEHALCVYISDPDAQCVHKLDVYKVATRWAVKDKPRGLSVSAAHNVIVTCADIRKIKEFSSDGDLLRELTLPDDVINPHHAIQTHNGQFIVCHGYHNDPLHRVCVVSADGCHIDHSHGKIWGKAIGQYNVPRHLAVDDSELVYVDDVFNRRVTVLSPTLEYICVAVSREQLKWRPVRLCLDIKHRLLYIADNEWKNEDKRWTSGRVVVFGV